MVKLCFDKLVLQPTSLCNLNCHYCYLPDRNHNRKMSPKITERLAETLGEAGLIHKTKTVIWHGGEPLSCGYSHFTELLQPLTKLEQSKKIKYAIQTNATLINERWCDLFILHKFNVGVSLDGPTWANLNRVDWKGSGAYSKILKGIQQLIEAGIPVNIIAVVGKDSLSKAQQLYDFFSNLGCQSLAINIEELEGVNQNREIIDDDQVTKFWRELFQAWRANPVIQIREFRQVLLWMKLVKDRLDTENKVAREKDIFPTIAWNGDVTVLSPELAGAKSDYYSDFVVGNIYKQSISEIIELAKSAVYVKDFASGIEKCELMCPIFTYCGGGQASNKFYEVGTTNTTETAFCRNTRKRLVDAVIDAL